MRRGMSPHSRLNSRREAATAGVASMSGSTHTAGFTTTRTRTPSSVLPASRLGGMVNQVPVVVMKTPT